MAALTVANSRRAPTQCRLLGAGRRLRCVVRRGQALRRSVRRATRAASVSPLLLDQTRIVSRAHEKLDWEERGARAAAEFLRRVAAAKELRAAAAAARAARRVTFTEEPPSVLEVVPYSEVYGLHPREFVFARDYSLVPSQGQFGFNGFDFVATGGEDEEDDICESDEDFDEF